MIRVGFDVSFAAPKPGRPAVVTGVGRVIERVLINLREEPDLDVKAVGAFHGDWNPVSTSIMSQRWATSINASANISIPSFRSRTGLACVLAPLQVKLEAWASERARLTPSRMSAKILRQVVDCDTMPSLDHRNIDVFCSTFLPPPVQIPATIPRVVVIHDMYPTRYPRESPIATVDTLRATCDQLIPSRDVVVTVSKYTKMDFCELTKFPRDRVIVAPLAADWKFRPISDQEAIKQVRIRYSLGNEPFLLSVANPQPRKNLPTVIRAFAAVVRRCPQWNGNLVMAGDPNAGSGSAEIDREVARHPLLDRRTIRTGTVAEDDLPALYGAAIGFVFPSTFEGFGLPVLEAMQCGTPVVCSATTSLPEVAGEAAVLVQPTDINAIADALVRIIENPGVARSMSRAGIEQAAKFGWRKTASHVASAIRFAAKTGTR